MVHPGAQPGTHARLLVADDGVGIDEETMSHIFEPFFTTKELSSRPGLGLTMVYGSVKQMGGFVQVESQLEKGTRFCVFLPAAESGSSIGVG